MSLADLMKPGGLRGPARERPALSSSGALPLHSEPQRTETIAANAPVPLTPDLDRWCWPHSDAMNGAEIVRMVARIELFQRRGKRPAEAERLADSLVARDRDNDERRMCIECAHLQRSGACMAAQQGRLFNAPAHLVPMQTLLQRCEGFAWRIDP
jgi:hypothetical protein